MEKFIINQIINQRILRRRLLENNMNTDVSSDNLDQEGDNIMMEASNHQEHDPPKSVKPETVDVKTEILPEIPSTATENGSCSDVTYPHQPENSKDELNDDILEEDSDNADTILDYIDSLTQEIFDAIKKGILLDVEPNLDEKIELILSYWNKVPNYLRSKEYQTKIESYLEITNTEQNNLGSYVIGKFIRDLENKLNPKIRKLKATRDKCRDIVQKLYLDEDWDEKERKECIDSILKECNSSNLELLSGMQLDFADSGYAEINQ